MSLAAQGQPSSQDSLGWDAEYAIVVTAQKQEETLQEVPLSVSVFSDQDVEDTGAQSTIQLADFVPNMMFIDEGVPGFHSPCIRGVQASGTSMSVSAGMYVDGVPFTSAPGFEDILLDIERIEVLRGPQGTLYGKNTEIGAINIVTRKPDNHWRGNFSADGGRLLDVETGDGLKGTLSLSLSGPIVDDKLFLGLAGRYFQRDGFMENSRTGASHGDRKNWFGRGHVRWKPTDRFDVSLIFSHLQYDDAGPVMQLTEEAAVSYGLSAPVHRRVESNIADENTSASQGQSLKISYKINDHLTLTSISARRFFEHKTLFDYDFSPMTLFHSDTDSEYTKISQELRFGYEKKKLKCLVGLYCDNDSDALYYVIDSMFPMMASTTDRSFDGVSYAAFSNITYPLLDTIRLVAGLRFEVQDKEMKNHNATGQKIDDSWKSITPKIALEYVFSPAAMGFVSVAKGYRSGGFNMFAQNPDYYSYDEENLWSYEAGIKGSFLDSRLFLNGALFYLDITDMQVNEAVTPLEVYLSNAAEASGFGAELEMTAHMTHGLSLLASFGYTDLTFDTFADALGDYKGNQNPYAPRYTFNVGAQYRHPCGFFARSDFIGYGKMYLNKTNDCARDAFQVLNAKIGYETDRFDVYLYGKNIFDKQYDTVGYGGMYTVYSAPGEIGFKCTYKL